MKISNEGLSLIKSLEGLRLEAYKAVPTEQYYTIGYGHYGADVKAGMKITSAQAEVYLMSDIAKFEKKVMEYDDTYHWNQNQFDALVSFAYNVGSIKQLTCNGSRTIAQISNCIPLYNKSGGRVLPGLTRRRELEKLLFDRTSDTTRKTNEEIAVEVWQGKWGNGTGRKELLESAGYDYRTIQALVNSGYGRNGNDSNG